jgi:hypothetical protein
MIRSIAFVALFAVLVGCRADPAAPTFNETLYLASAVDGGTLPRRGFENVSNEAGSCVLDLFDASISFNSGKYDYNVRFEQRCTGSTTVVRNTVRAQGGYLREGITLSFTPTVQTSETLLNARISGGDVVLNVRRGSGKRYELLMKPYP